MFYLNLNSKLIWIFVFQPPPTHTETEANTDTHRQGCIYNARAEIGSNPMNQEPYLLKERGENGKVQKKYIIVHCYFLYMSYIKQKG